MNISSKFFSDTTTLTICQTSPEYTSVILLPLDALKVKAQTAPEQLHGRGVVSIIWNLFYTDKSI